MEHALELLADGRLYHFDWGIVDRRLAGFAPSREHLIDGLPEHLRVVVYPPGAWSDQMRPRSATPTELDGLAGWTAYLVGSATTEPRSAGEP